jgi:hypothetical protein
LHSYSNALQQQATTNEILVIKRNRALAFLKTSQLDAALADTGFPNLTAQSAEKALFRAAEALYYLGQFDESFKVLTLLCNTYPDNQQAKQSLCRARNRVEEQKTGSYNFKQPQAEAMKLKPPQLDHASYVGSLRFAKQRPMAVEFCHQGSKDRRSVAVRKGIQLSLRRRKSPKAQCTDPS